jgi:hypothetical protein
MVAGPGYVERRRAGRPPRVVRGETRVSGGYTGTSGAPRGALAGWGGGAKGRGEARQHAYDPPAAGRRSPQWGLVASVAVPDHQPDGNAGLVAVVSVRRCCPAPAGNGGHGPGGCPGPHRRRRTGRGLAARAEPARSAGPTGSSSRTGRHPAPPGAEGPPGRSRFGGPVTTRPDPSRTRRACRKRNGWAGVVRPGSGPSFRSGRLVTQE